MSDKGRQIDLLSIMTFLVIFICIALSMTLASATESKSSPVNYINLFSFSPPSPAANLLGLPDATQNNSPHNTWLWVIGIILILLLLALVVYLVIWCRSLSHIFSNENPTSYATDYQNLKEANYQRNAYYYYQLPPAEGQILKEGLTDSIPVSNLVGNN